MSRCSARLRMKCRDSLVSHKRASSQRARRSQLGKAGRKGSNNGCVKKKRRARFRYGRSDGVREKSGSLWYQIR